MVNGKKIDLNIFNRERVTLGSHLILEVLACSYVTIGLKRTEREYIKTPTLVVCRWWNRRSISLSCLYPLGPQVASLLYSLRALAAFSLASHPGCFGICSSLQGNVTHLMWSLQGGGHWSPGRCSGSPFHLLAHIFHFCSLAWVGLMHADLSQSYASSHAVSLQGLGCWCADLTGHKCHR